MQFPLRSSVTSGALPRPPDSINALPHWPMPLRTRCSGCWSLSDKGQNGSISRCRTLALWVGVLHRGGSDVDVRASLSAAAQAENGVITAKSSQTGARMKIATAPWPQLDQSHPHEKTGWEKEDKYGNGSVTDSP